MTRTRRDVAKLGEGWNETLLWYAKAIIELDKRSISDHKSWRFLGAIHGFHEQTWSYENLFRPGEATPPELVDNTFGDQCQHGNWYFLPWHRGYLAAFEAIIAEQVEKLGGPTDWALPYWNYLDDQNPNARNYPDAFLQEFLPDGSENPLSSPPRRDIDVLVPPEPGLRDINLNAMHEPDFVVGADGSIGFGGSNRVAGDLEFNPHNSVHVIVGGPGGFMYDPNLAGLDPIFWVHHCNIDRLWEAWMQTPGRTTVREARWLNGPKGRHFLMPSLDESAEAIKFTPRDTLKGGPLHPTYDDLSRGTGVTHTGTGAGGVSMGSTRTQSVEVLGASEQAVTVGGSSTKTTVRLDAAPTAAAVQAMGPIEAGRDVVRLYLQLENVKGEAPSAVVDVFVNLPDGAAPADHPEHRAESLYLFGLARASAPDGTHAGNGLGLSVDITDLAARLSTAGKFDLDHIDVSIFPVEGSSEGAPVTIDRVSVLKRSVSARD